MSTKTRRAKFTFKKHPRRTGLSGVGYPHQSVDIKFNRHRVGVISAPSWETKDNRWTVGVMIVDETAELPWRWTWFKKRFENEQAARDWANENAERIVALGLYHHPDE
jgi:hypothetical protein